MDESFWQIAQKEVGNLEKDSRYSIGETSMITGVPAKTLRYYDSLKLIIPEIRDPQNNYRYYSKNQVIQLLAVQRLRTMGCSCQMLRNVMQENSLAALCNQIELRIHELEEEIATRTAIINENADFLKRLKYSLEIQASSSDHGAALLDNVRVEEIPKTHIFCEQRLMPNYDVCDTSVDFRLELYANCKDKGLSIIGPEITTYYTNLLGQFVMSDCKIQIGIAVEPDPTCEEIQTFGGFTAVTAVHLGSYDSMVNTHMMMLRWINENGYEVDGYVSEEFMISPIDILEQKNQIIKVIMPVRKVKQDGKHRAK